jgi:hypothetical protein
MPRKTRSMPLRRKSCGYILAAEAVLSTLRTLQKHWLGRNLEYGACRLLPVVCRLKPARLNSGGGTRNFKLETRN